MVLSRWSDKTMLAMVIQEEVHSGFACDECEGNPMDAEIEKWDQCVVMYTQVWRPEDANWTKLLVQLEGMQGTENFKLQSGMMSG